MRNLVILILFTLFTIDMTYAQNKFIFQSRSFKRERHRIYLSAGATNFLGDLGGANQIGSPPGSLRDFDVEAIKPAFQVGYLYRMANMLSSRTSFTYASLSGNDAYTKEPFRQNRNLNFKAPVYELSSVIEVLWEFKRKGHQYFLRGVRGWSNYRFTTYLYAGAAISYFDSKGKNVIDDKWYRLRPLSTEGQGLLATRGKYSPIQFSVPLGVGVRGRVSRFIEIGIEYTARICFTDYIDDVSTTYFDEETLKREKGDIAAQMANPALDNNPGDPLYTSTREGQQRGDPRDRDSWLAVMISMYYTIGRGYTPRIRNR